MNATMTLREDALTETYYDVEKLIYDICWKFKGIYGGDFEELAAEANLAYIKAFNKFDGSKGKFSTWLHFTIWKRLLNFRVNFTHPVRYGRTIEYVEMIHPASMVHENTEHRFVDLLDEVKADAQEIINLFLDIPEVVQVRAIEKGGRAQNLRTSMKEYARHTLGWTHARIRETFQELTELMNPKDDITLEEILDVIKN